MKTVVTFIGDYIRTIAALITFGVVWLLDVLTLHGLLASLYLQPDDDLLWPTATRVIWLLLILAAADGVIARLLWREGVLSFTSTRQLLAAAPVSAIKRLTRRVRWWAGGIGSAYAQWSAHRPVKTTETVPVPTTRTVPDLQPAATPAAA